MEEAAATAKLNVVLFPWLAFGHMIPFLELAKRLAARGHAVTFLSTPRNVARLPPVPTHLSSRIRLVALPAPRVEGLPEGAESTADVPPEKNELIKKAVDALAVPFAAFLADATTGGSKPDWIVNDFCHHWLPAIADEHKVPCAMFVIVQATMMAFLGPRWANDVHPRTTLEDFTVPPNWCPFPPAIAYRRHEAAWTAGAFQPNASEVSDVDRLWQIIERSRLTIYRSCDEVEPGVFALLTDLFQKPAIPAGVLLQPKLDDGDGDSSSCSEVLRWLDNQPPKSVIYVALGSEAPLTANNLHELALGLELAGVRFMWSFRKPAGTSAPDADVVRLLPAGFEERTRGHGLVWPGWVPQVRVLAHGAVGAFLTHCGWGSTIESLVFGHPLVMLPFVVDQGLIARTMAERGVGVEVARDDSDGWFGRDGVAAAVRRVMVDEEGKVFASNVRKLKEVLSDQRRQDQYMDELVGYLRRYRDDNC
ncbi:putative UDP-rhamnose:rhamnosyltransferase 1 [Phragmites australis]|uniref:putative UDP-rhamnose:rhamnosyltransferase 1 n=1 Tax=Phragmites australis TaxID=29695 RepID=UPI002D7A0400|nr:putative UDP-rhamnose:rhamnosyltransferase 1 [Phragmites australis]